MHDDQPHFDILLLLSLAVCLDTFNYYKTEIKISVVKPANQNHSYIQELKEVQCWLTPPPPPPPPPPTTPPLKHLALTL